ncbi:MAG: hypothetical protein GXP62_19165 [Oligoflexia bacterium]|nr:hypothetical protein [Oligoflexia bacterium]
MLDAFIIEKIRRERERKRDQDRAGKGLHLPVDGPGRTERPVEIRPEPPQNDERDGGAIVVDFTI